MFGISNSVKSREVRECTPDLFRRVVRSERVARICAEIEDALEKCVGVKCRKKISRFPKRS